MLKNIVFIIYVGFLSMSFVSSVKAKSCPVNSSRSESGCSCNDGYIVDVSKRACVPPALYDIDELMDDAVKVKVCLENDYLPQQAYDSAVDRTRYYAKLYIKEEEKEKLEVQTKIKEKRTSSMFGIGCEAAYTRIMKLPARPAT